VKFGLRSIIVPYEMFGKEVECVIGPIKNLAKYVSWRFEQDDVSQDGLERGRGWTFVRDGYVPIIWIPRFPVTPADHGTLAHEMAHALIYLFDRVGVPIAPDADETFCHAMSYGITKVLEARNGR
jgi:hypothetical protein